MGMGRTLTCTGCGYEMGLSVGCGFMGDPCRPDTREDVLEGRYGPWARKALEKNRDARFCGCYSALFRCTCGNYASKDAVFISDGRKAVYRPSMKCGLCHRKMWEVQELPYRARCPRCGSGMSATHEILWD